MSCAALGIVSGLAGCGGHAYPDGARGVATAYLSTNAPSKCDYLTPELVESLTQRRGHASLAACRRNVQRFSAPRRVSVREAEVDERDAELEMLSDGSEARLKLVKAGDRWQIAEFGE